jgi:hypothetical protein
MAGGASDWWAKRQQLIEADEANSAVELNMLSKKLALTENRGMAYSFDYSTATESYTGFAQSASAAVDPLLARRQMLLEEEEANSIMQMQVLEEKLKIDQTRQMLFNLDSQIQAVQGTVQEAAENVQEAAQAVLTSGEEYARQLPGALPGLGFFDPLGILTGSTQEKVQYYRDAELKHGRIGTLAAIGIVVSENFHPFGGDELNGVPAVLAFEHHLLIQTFVVASMAALASRPQLVPDTTRKQTTEIWHVRGGMLAAFSMIAQETMTNMPFALAHI